MRPGEGGGGVFDGGREGMLRRQSVVDRQHGRAGGRGEEATDAVVGLEVADHPAAAVEVEEEGGRAVGRQPPWQVEAGRKRPGVAWDLELFDPRHRDRRPARGRFGAAAVVGSRRRGRQPFRERGLARDLGEADKGVEVGREDLAVDARRRPEEQPLQAGGQPADELQQPVLGTRRESWKLGHRGARLRQMVQPGGDQVPVAALAPHALVVGPPARIPADTGPFGLIPRPRPGFRVPWFLWDAGRNQGTAERAAAGALRTPQNVAAAALRGWLGAVALRGPVAGTYCGARLRGAARLAVANRTSVTPNLAFEGLGSTERYGGHGHSSGSGDQR